MKAKLDERKEKAGTTTHSSREDRLSIDHLGKDTSHRPDIDSSGVLLEGCREGKEGSRLSSTSAFLPRRVREFESEGEESQNSLSMTSGARYHLVATYSVMNPAPPLGPASGGGRAAERASPKSQI